ncbi:helix-turn-helix domain-containing protein [Cognatilysobacter bugurensis]|uniref:Transcriptional regulator n=1 Tax=Cognatilysobacter bugurensis TaxID=543356 RepID=A0A918ST38_9GAMM|nr:transcriptional regulator [Lysobacter bugurensis]
MTFAVRVRQARRRMGLSQAALALQVGVARSAVAQWERARRGTRPCNKNLARLAVVIGVSYEWLSTGRGRMATDGADGETPALLLNHYAHDELEERLLVAFRRVANGERQPFVDFIEALAGQRNAA